MVHAVESFFPETKLAIGPAIEDGIYYDFDSPQSLTLNVLSKIEERMEEIVVADRPLVREEMSQAAAIELFRHLNEPYKVELLEEVDDSVVPVYQEGDFVNHYRGPHMDSTGHIKAFKLLLRAGHR